MATVPILLVIVFMEGAPLLSLTVDGSHAPSFHDLEKIWLQWLLFLSLIKAVLAIFGVPLKAEVP